MHEHSNRRSDFDGGTENRAVHGFTSLLDEVDSKEIAAQYNIGFHSNRIDFLERIKIGLRLGIADPNTLEDFAQQTDVYADLERVGVESIHGVGRLIVLGLLLMPDNDWISVVPRSLDQARKLSPENASQPNSTWFPGQL